MSHESTNVIIFVDSIPVAGLANICFKKQAPGI